MVEKCECGLNYVIGEPENERWHSIVHENYLTGPKLPILLNGKKVGKFDDFIVVQVSDESTEKLRSSASKLALTAHYSTPDYPAGYDGSVGHELKVYALLYGEHAIGFLLRSKTTRSWQLRWNGEGKAELVTNDANLDKKIVVARLWIAKHYHRKGFGDE